MPLQMHQFRATWRVHSKRLRDFNIDIDVPKEIEELISSNYYVVDDDDDDDEDEEEEEHDEDATLLFLGGAVPMN